jgi:hypothetical protein
MPHLASQARCGISRPGPGPPSAQQRLRGCQAQPRPEPAGERKPLMRPCRSRARSLGCQQFASFLAVNGRSSEARARPAHSGCEDLLYIELQGRASRAGPGLAAVHAKAPRDSGADCRAAQRPPVAGWPSGDRDVPGAGCLPLALRATSAPARTQPRGRPHGQRSVTSAVLCGVTKEAIPPAPAF